MQPCSFSCCAMFSFFSRDRSCYNSRRASNSQAFYLQVLEFQTCRHAGHTTTFSDDGPGPHLQGIFNKYLLHEMKGCIRLTQEPHPQVEYLGKSGN